ncbi:MAG: hypothetical protein NWE98_09545 [Candidatus Bathyarchaeota archaeon]|nr:hypothetical protein [Candidatus Bathyarchaeota archaeon]
MAGYADPFIVRNSASVCFAVNTGLPEITILSPANHNYSATPMALNLWANEPLSLITYSLDGQSNVTFSGNATLEGLAAGTHDLKIYATDMAGNTVAKNVQFDMGEEIMQSTLESQYLGLSSVILAAVLAASIVVITISLLIFFKKRGREVGDH